MAIRLARFGTQDMRPLAFAPRAGRVSRMPLRQGGENRRRGARKPMVQKISARLLGLLGLSAKSHLPANRSARAILAQCTQYDWPFAFHTGANTSGVWGPRPQQRGQIIGLDR